MKRKINVRLLRKIQRAIMERPDQFEMSMWFSHYLMFRDQDQAVPAGGCGTAACIAGWAITLNSKTPKPAVVCDRLHRSFQWSFSDRVFEKAQRLLGLSEGQARSLFMDEHWPEPFYENYNKTNKPAVRARVACQRIDHFIKTKGEE